MNRWQFFQALTLWFVVLLFVRTAPGGDGLLGTVTGVVALVLIWWLPIYLLYELYFAALSRYGADPDGS
ncbi:hypothetical protein [Halobaculum sp. D14]|uniref:hypothetical protein n=1 Tax=Halobaculum sp. D14 TaxID=3421642 RepID=UPI003EB79C31